MLQLSEAGGSTTSIAAASTACRVLVAQLSRQGKPDVVYDLGSGDGRIVITAAKKYGARGIEIDPDLVKRATEWTIPDR